MLGWSFKLFRIAGIRLAVHYSFLLLLGFAAWEGAQAGGVSGALLEMTLLLAFFTCVVLHELGHCFAAQRYGIRANQILLMPIGGMAEFERIPREPRMEMSIAVAGPLVNVAIMLLLVGFVRFAGVFSNGSAGDAAWSGVNGFLLQIFFANAAMATLNLLPVFPMDGGRVLRAALATRFPYLKATRLASLTAKVVACIGIALALWFDLWLLALLFAFVIFVGDAEYRSVKRAELESQHWSEYWSRYRSMIAEPPEIPPLNSPNPSGTEDKNRETGSDRGGA